MITAEEARNLYEEEADKKRKEDVEAAKQWVDEVVEPLVRDAIKARKTVASLTVQGHSEAIVEEYLVELGFQVYKKMGGTIFRIGW